MTLANQLASLTPIHQELDTQIINPKRQVPPQRRH